MLTGKDLKKILREDVASGKVASNAAKSVAEVLTSDDFTKDLEELVRYHNLGKLCNKKDYEVANLLVGDALAVWVGDIGDRKEMEVV